MTEMPKRCFIACLVTETNSFSPIPSGREVFECGFVFHGDATNHPKRLFTDVLHEWRKLAEHDGIQIIESLSAFAQPAGLVDRHVYEDFRDEILADLESAGPLDMVLLMLHGAMVAEGYLDCEGDLLARVRTTVGPTMPVGVELDPHCNMSERMLRHATAIVISRRYPHTDFVERGGELYRIVRDTAAGSVKPVMHHVRIPMIGAFPTASAPMQDLLARMDDLDITKGVLSTSLIHGFPWSDNPDMGAGALLVTDKDQLLAKRLVDTLADAFFSVREHGKGKYLNTEEVLKLALDSEPGLLVIADFADNPGGGAPGDGTYLLKAFLDAGIANAAFLMIFDPDCVRQAIAAGVGSTLHVVLGGKHGILSGPSLKLEVEVLAIAEDARQRGLSPDTWEPLGPSVCLRTGDIYVIVNSFRQSTFSPDPLLQLGVNPGRLKTIVVKSSHHFENGFANVANRIVHCSGMGCLSLNFAELPYRQIRRPMWPLDTVEILQPTDSRAYR